MIARLVSDLLAVAEEILKMMLDSIPQQEGQKVLKRWQPYC
jgi:hypothetical protein